MHDLDGFIEESNEIKFDSSDLTDQNLDSH
jgi:hypothetical protein